MILLRKINRGVGHSSAVLPWMLRGPGRVAFISVSLKTLIKLSLIKRKGRVAVEISVGCIAKAVWV